MPPIEDLESSDNALSGTSSISKVENQATPPISCPASKNIFKSSPLLNNVTNPTPTFNPPGSQSTSPGIPTPVAVIDNSESSPSTMEEAVPSSKLP